MNANTSESEVQELGEVRTLAVAEPKHSVEALLFRAVENGASVESLERLLAMSERVKAEAARQAFFDALSAFQADCPVIAKRKTASAGNYSYRYAPLEDIVRTVSPLLRAHGLSYRFDTAFEATTMGQAQVVTCIVHHREGHFETSEFRTPIDAGARMNDMQKSASAQTYAKRYAFCNALGILTGDEDDDGHGAGGGDRRGVPTSRVAPGGTTAVAPQQPATSPSAPRPLGRNVVRIQKPAAEPSGTQAQVASAPSPEDDASVSEMQDSDSRAQVDTVADADEAVSELRVELINSQMALLRTTSKYRDYDNDALWERATSVLDATCQMHWNKPLHQMGRWDLQRAATKMRELVAERTGSAA